MSKKSSLFAALLFFSTCVFLRAQPITLASPDKRLEIQIGAGDQLTWSVTYDGAAVLLPGEIGLELGDGRVLGRDARVRRQSRKAVDEAIAVDVPVKTSEIRNHFNSLLLTFRGGYAVEFRAFDQGAAYRFITALKGDLEVANEISEFMFPQGATTFFPEEESLYSHYERSYLFAALDTLEAGKFCSLPVLMDVNGRKILITESDLYDYPGMFLFKKTDRGLEAQFPERITGLEPTKGSEDRNETILATDSTIAQTSGNRTFPWRICAVGDEEMLLENNLVYQLARPLAIEDASWIKPGKVAWDWYNALNIYGVDFESGLNTQTYKYYIDFASAYNLEYIILDEGWSKSTTEIGQPADAIDIAELVAYGKEKNVSVILWVLWKPLDENLNSILKTYSDWGVAGIKVDFMQRADQEMVNYYERVARESARHKLLVDFHGAYKPAGLRRAYPNVISYEGVKGNENNKWSKDVTPEHNVTLPFTRMVAGPMDFTPGAMANAQLVNHAVSFQRPMSLGTRCHQMAMYVVFESPLQMLCDVPSAYYETPDLTRFISRIPTVWDETVALANKVGDFVSVARRRGDQWFIGAMTDWTSRTLTLDLDFLPAGTFKLEVLKDGVNAGKFAEDYAMEERSVTKGETIEINLAAGGGWVGILSKE